MMETASKNNENEGKKKNMKKGKKPGEKKWEQEKNFRYD